MNIYITIGLIIAAIVITLIVSYILPKEKVRAANQSLNEQEQKLELQIKDLEKDFIQKKSDLEKDFIQRQSNLEKEYNQKNIELEKQYEETSNQYQLQNEEKVKELEEKSNEINQLRINWDKEYNDKILNWTKKEADLQTEVRGLEERRNNIIQTLEKEAKESGEIFKSQQLQIAQEQIEKAKEELLNEYMSAQENAKSIYLETLADMVADITSQYGIKAKELEDTLVKLAEAQAKANAVIESNKRAELEKQAKNFYRLQLSQEDLEEIKRLREVEPFLRDKEPLNKVIYKCYYEKSYTNLVGRVVGVGRKTGIYKITCLLDGRTYVGQAIDIAERWRQHIKRGVGAEPVTQNKLYPAMKELGVENFTFEILEECKPNELSEREKFYTDFYQSNSYGFVVRKG